MPTIEIEGAKLHYRDEGAGDDVVLLLHAFPLNSGMWSRQIAALATKRRVIAPDYRGFGGSSISSEPVTMALLAQDVRALLAELGVARAAVAGLSMGGYVAFELFRQAPSLFRGLALCDTKASADTEEGRSGRETFARTTLEKGLDWVAESMIPKLLKPSPDPRSVSEVRALIAAASPEGVAAAQRAMAARPDSFDTLAAIECPLVIIEGALDSLTPLPDAEKMVATAKGARLVTIGDAGHIACIENPETFTTALERFLDGLPA